MWSVDRMKRLTDRLSLVSSTTLPPTRVASFRTLNSGRCIDRIQMWPSLVVDPRRSVLLPAKKQFVSI